MSDPSVPEADALEQQQEAGPSVEPEEERTESSGDRGDHVPLEAPEADVLEQNQPADMDDQFEEHDVDVERGRL